MIGRSISPPGNTATPTRKDRYDPKPPIATHNDPTMTAIESD
ncbi:hypothetical protein [Alloactinosynnema sp. L-07]|nr:hypothetical protein [Alloactinosynnema sp. L-07]